MSRLGSPTFCYAKSMSTRVAVLYGIVSGQRIGKYLYTALEQAGYSLVSDPKDADIIIAHSAGCFWLPAHTPAILIDPPYWPGRPAAHRVRNRLASYMHLRRNNYTLKQWLWRTLWGSYYAVFDFRRNNRIISYADHFDLKTVIKDRPVVIIRNGNDDWLSPAVHELAASNTNLSIVDIPGDHDDCWIHPEPYVAALKQLQ